MKLVTLKWNKQNKNDWMVKKDQGIHNWYNRKTVRHKGNE